MKKSVLSLVVILILGVQFAVGQSKKESCDASCNHNKLKTQAVLFEKGKVYEIAYAEVVPEKVEQLSTQYFPKALKISAEYGGKLIASFNVVKNESKNFPAQMIVIFEWPNAEARLSLLKNKEYQKITYLRDEAIKKLQLGYFQVPESKAITFRSDKVYEFGAADLVKNGFEKLKAYNEIAEPYKRNYGGAYPEFIINFGKADSKGQATYVPQMQFIVEWASLADNKKLFKNKGFAKNAVPVLLSAIDKFDAVFTKFSFE